MPSTHASLLEQLEQVKNRYLAELPEQLDEIQKLWSQLLQAWDANKSEALLQRLHKLAGSCASFGCAELGDTARNAELHLNDLISSDTHDHEAKQAISALIDIFKQWHPEKPSGRPDARIRFNTAQTSVSKFVYILEDDREFAEALTLNLASYGFKTESFYEVETFCAAIESVHPCALIIDVQLNEGKLAGIDLVKRLKMDWKVSIPILMFTVRDDFHSKLSAHRAGADVYLVKPIETDILVNELDRVISAQDNLSELRILLVDDDIQLANHNGLILQQAGMLTKSVNDPTKACDAISDFSPDLIILDLYMPSCSGLELAQVIRFHPHYLHIPIVYLSTEAQLSKQLDALTIGGDDFLTKPITDNHLVRAVKYRALRAKRLNELVSKDSLTGLFKHTFLKEKLIIDYANACRSSEHFCFVIIDLDDFKLVNDNHGHLMGDRVLKSLAGMLKHRLRQGDSVGRIGGEEFGLILHHCEMNKAKTIVDALRVDFFGQEFRGTNGTFSVSFSGGISYSGNEDNADALLNAADTALYDAKRAGRNQIKTAPIGKS